MRRTAGQQPKRDCQYRDLQAVTPASFPQRLEFETKALVSPLHSGPAGDNPNEGIFAVHQQSNVSPYPSFGYRVDHPRHPPSNQNALGSLAPATC